MKKGGNLGVKAKAIGKEITGMKGKVVGGPKGLTVASEANKKGVRKTKQMK